MVMLTLYFFYGTGVGTNAYLLVCPHGKSVFPDPLGNLKKRRCLQTFKQVFKLASRTSASFRISQTTLDSFLSLRHQGVGSRDLSPLPGLA